MCGGPAPVFSLLRPTQHITLMKPKAMANGGMVSPSDINIPPHVLAEDDPDKVLVRLAPGELVVPKKHVGRVGKYLRRSGIILPGM